MPGNYYGRLVKDNLQEKEQVKNLFTRQEVFNFVDALFHKYASMHRMDAKEELADILQRREEMIQKGGKR